MQLMGVQAIYPKPRLSQAVLGIGVSLSVARAVDRAALSGLEFGHHVYSDGPRFMYLVAIIAGSAAMCSPGDSRTRSMEPSVWTRSTTPYSKVGLRSSTPIKARNHRPRVHRHFGNRRHSREHGWARRALDNIFIDDCGEP